MSTRVSIRDEVARYWSTSSPAAESRVGCGAVPPSVHGTRTKQPGPPIQPFSHTNAVSSLSLAETTTPAQRVKAAQN